MVAGCVLGALLLVNLLVLDRGIRYGQLDVVNAVARHGYRDPFVDELLADEYRLAALDGDRDLMLERAGWFANRRLANYPVHHAYVLPGEIAFVQGDLDAAEAIERSALVLQPWNPLSHGRLLVLAEDPDDREMYEASMRVLCAIGSATCDPGGFVARADPTPTP